MTASEAGVGAEEGGRLLGPAWRAERERLQEAALAGVEDAVLSCSAAFGAGGLGRHLKEMDDALERAGRPARCVCASCAARVGGPGCVEVAPDRLTGSLGRLARHSPAWRMRAASVAFDIAAARSLPSARQLIAFGGQSLRQQRAARSGGYETVSLVSPTSHLRQVQRRYERAYSSHPIERPWSGRLIERSLAEYAAADRIYVSSTYVWESFVAEGIPESKLRMFPLTPDPRFEPAPRERRETFDVVYVGSLSVVKGVPVLIEAVRRLAAQDLRLLLVGGWESRGMRRYIERAMAEDPRIEHQLGNPLQYLRGASLYVHPSYEDGFSYSSVEAMACGVPVIVSDATGMKELIEPGRTGAVVAAGDGDALAGLIEAVHRGELLGG